MELTPSVHSSCAQKPYEHVRAARQHNIGAKNLAGVNVACHVAQESGDVDFARLKAWLAQHCRVTEAFDSKKKNRLVEQPV